MNDEMKKPIGLSQEVRERIMAILADAQKSMEVEEDTLFMEFVRDMLRLYFVASETVGLRGDQLNWSIEDGLGSIVQCAGFDGAVDVQEWFRDNVYKRWDLLEHTMDLDRGMDDALGAECARDLRNAPTVLGVCEVVADAMGLRVPGCDLYRRVASAWTVIGKGVADEIGLRDGEGALVGFVQRALRICRIAAAKTNLRDWKLLDFVCLYFEYYVTSHRRDWRDDDAYDYSDSDWGDDVSAEELGQMYPDEGY